MTQTLSILENVDASTATVDGGAYALVYSNAGAVYTLTENNATYAGGVQTTTTLNDTALLRAYDVDGAAYVTFGTLTAANTPTLVLSGTGLDIHMVPITLAAAGANQSAATGMSPWSISNVTTGTGGVRLPVPTGGEVVVLLNRLGVQITNYPHSGGTINGGATDAGTGSAPLTATICYATSTTNWEILRGVQFSGTTPVALGLGATGTSLLVARSDHVHPDTTVVAAPAGAALTTADLGKTYTNEGASAIAPFTLPTAVAGYRYTFIVNDADGIRVTAASGDTIRVAASVSAAAGKIENSTIGSCVTLVSLNVTEWFAVTTVGTWVAT